MARLSQDEAEALKQALSNADPNKALATADAKDLFCKGWPVVKRVLEWVAARPETSPELKDAIEKAIDAGDMVHGMICPR